MSRGPVSGVRSQFEKVPTVGKEMEHESVQGGEGREARGKGTARHQPLNADWHSVGEIIPKENLD